MSTDFDVPGDDRNDDFWYNFGYDALTLSVDSYALDGHDSGTHGLRDAELEVGDLEWDELTLEGEITVPDGLLDYVFEDGADPSSVGRLLVRGDCLSTHNRFVACEVSDTISTGTIPIDVTLDRELFDDVVTLRPVLVRDDTDVDDEARDYRYGQTPGQKLADGPAFRVLLDTDGDSNGSFLRIESKEFTGSPPEDHVFHLDHSNAEQPTLWINSKVDLLVPALKSEATYGKKRWTKEVLEKLIGQPVWVELVLWTAADVSEGECRHDWQRDVVEILSDAMYEDETADEIARDLEERIGDPGRVPYLLEESNRAVQEFLDPDGELENLLEEIL